MGLIGSAVGKLKLDNSQFNRAVAKSNRSMGKLKSGFGKLGKMAAVGLGLGIAAATGAMVLGVKKAADYDQALTNAVSVTGLSGKAARSAKKDMDALAMQLGRDTAFSAKEAADAMYDLASSGWDAGKMQKGIRGIMDLAASTQSDLAFATETTTSTLAQFGLKAKDSGRVADVFTKAIGSSKATLEKLSGSMNYIGPIAHAMGWSLEQTTAVLEKLYDAGFKGEKAGTALNRALTILANPVGGATKALKKLGISVADVNPKTHKFTEILKTLHDHGMDANSAMQLFGEAAPEILAITDKSKDIDKLTTALDNSGKTAERVAKEQLSTLSGQWKILKGSSEGLLIELGKIFIPMLANLATSITPVVNKMSSWISAFREGRGAAGLFKDRLVAFMQRALSAVKGLANFIINVYPTVEPIILAVAAALIGMEIAAAAAVAVEALSNALLILKVALIAIEDNPIIAILMLIATAVLALTDYAYQAATGHTLLGAAMGYVTGQAHDNKTAYDESKVALNQYNDAVRASSDAELQLRQAKLDQKQAILEQKKAQEDLKKVQGDSKTTNEQLEQAELRVEQANLRVDQSASRVKTAQEKQSKASDAATVSAHNAKPAFEKVAVANGEISAKAHSANKIMSSMATAMPGYGGKAKTMAKNLSPLGEAWATVWKGAKLAWRWIKNALGLGPPPKAKSSSSHSPRAAHKTRASGGWASYGKYILGEMGRELVLPHNISSFFAKVGIPINVVSSSTPNAAGSYSQVRQGDISINIEHYSGTDSGLKKLARDLIPQIRLELQRSGGAL